MPIGQIQNVPIRKLHANPRNAHTHPKKQVRQIAESIERFGFASPIIADENYEVLAGHGRLAAAKLLGLRVVPVIVLAGLSDARTARFRIGR